MPAILSPRPQASQRSVHTALGPAAKLGSGLSSAWTGKGAGARHSSLRMAVLRAGASRSPRGRKKFLLYDGPLGGRLIGTTAERGRLMSYALDLGSTGRRTASCYRGALKSSFPFAS